MYIGNEPFLVNGHPINLTMNDYWRWAYSDLKNNINRSVLAEFIVASALDIIHTDSESTRMMWRPYDLLSSEGYRIEVKSAGYVQSHDMKHPDCISFRIAPARMPDETGDYKSDAPLQRNSDVYVFCIFKGLSADDNPLDMELWDFYVLPTDVLDEKKPTQKTITLPSLMQLEPLWCDYYGLSEAIKNPMTARD